MRRQWSHAMNSGLSAVGPQGAGSGGTVKTTVPARRPRSRGHTCGVLPETYVEAAHPSWYADCMPGVASQSSTSPGQSTRVEQCSVRPPRVRTVMAAGSTASTLSRTHVHPSGTTSRIGRSRSAIVACPPPT